ncbi:MAG: hypothetical protein MHPSP_000556, partial [Paramarteilia canceri]
QTVLLNCLKKNLNAQEIEKMSKKLLKVPKNPSIFGKELYIYKSIVMGSPKVARILILMEKNQAHHEKDIFRLSVDESDLQELSELLETESNINPTSRSSNTQFTNHHLAALLKKCLREFTDSLFPQRFLILYYMLDILLDREESFKETLQLINMLIPDSNIRILENLMRFLHQVIESPTSGVDENFLATMLLPSLFIPKSENYRTKKKRKEFIDLGQNLSTKTVILAKIISIGVEGFRTPTCAMNDLLALYNEIVKQNREIYQLKNKSIDKYEKKFRRQTLNAVEMRIQHSFNGNSLREELNLRNKSKSKE